MLVTGPKSVKWNVREPVEESREAAGLKRRIYMEDQKKIFGFIGTGNMGGALARAVRRTQDGGQILLANRSTEKACALAEELGAWTVDNCTLAQRAYYIFLGVKPQMMEAVLSEIAPVLAERRDRFLLVSMAAGLTLERIQEMAGGSYPLIRIMPNTPVSVGEGMVLYTCSPDAEEDIRDFLDGCKAAGRFSRLPEQMMDAASAVAGCGPAFADLFLEALADGGVACGLPRDRAQEYAAQMLAGAARLVLESGEHPGRLKDAVCSPGGTTIQGVRKLEEGGFRGNVMNAVIAAYEKTLELK